jgi:hypothetical protein
MLTEHHILQPSVIINGLEDPLLVYTVFLLHQYMRFVGFINAVLRPLLREKTQ